MPPSSLILATAWSQGVGPRDHALSWLHVLRSLSPDRFDQDAAQGWQWLRQHLPDVATAWPSWSALHRFHLGLRDTEFSRDGQGRWGRLMALPIAGRLSALPACLAALDRDSVQSDPYRVVWLPRVFRPAEVDRWGAQMRFRLLRWALEGVGVQDFPENGADNADASSATGPDTWGTRLMVGVAVGETPQPFEAGCLGSWARPLPAEVRAGQMGTLGEALAERAILHLDLALALDRARGTQVCRQMRSCRVELVDGDPTSLWVHLTGENGEAWGPCLVDACGLSEPDDLKADLQVWAQNLNTGDPLVPEQCHLLG